MYALEKYMPGVEWAMSDFDYDTLVMLKGDPKPSLEQLNLWADLIQQQSIADAYKYLREKEYPSINEQLDTLWHSMDSGEIPKSQTFYTTIKAVKDKYPKPS
jgi:hypothetical protein